jgi:phage terminase small subunit
MALNPRQSLFVASYLVHKNASKAAMEAGYSAKTAHSIGPRLLDNVEIQAEINAKLTKITQKLDLSVEKIASRLADFAFGKEYCEPRDAIRAAELLGKHLKMFTEKFEMSADKDVIDILLKVEE